MDVYNIAADDVPDDNGMVGMKIGTLRGGQQVELAGACQPNEWCKIVMPNQPGIYGFADGHLQF